MNNTTRQFSSCVSALLMCVLLIACGGGGGSGTGAGLGAGVTPGAGGTSTPQPGTGSSLYSPPRDLNDGWVVGDAVTMGANEAGIKQMVSAVEDGQYPGLDSIAVAWRNQLVYERTLRSATDDFDENVGNTDPELHAQFSVSKSVASLLIGIALRQDVFKNLEVPYLSLFDYPDVANRDARKEAIRLVDVLTMTAGFEWNEWDPPYNSPDNQLDRFHRENYDWSKGLLDLPMAHDPDSHFAYNTVASTSLGQAIENRAGLSLIDFAITYLVTPLQIAAIEVTRTPTELPDLGRGLFVTSRDIAKIGQVMLDGGRWDGQRLVSEDFAKKSVEAHVAIGWLDPEQWDWQITGYGYQWWTGTFDLEGRALESFAARGYGEQVVMVVPELELVIVANAKLYDQENDDLNQMYQLIREEILPAFAG
jgi:CubicO group peptidase (beta-lactamase class C family)